MMPRIRVGSVMHAQQQTRVPVNESSTPTETDGMLPHRITAACMYFR